MIAHISDDGLNREESVAEHTKKTAFLCREKGKRCGLEQVMLLCAISHDMGKCKKAFYDYIRADEDIRKKQRGKIAHASTGAKYIYDRYHDTVGNSSVMVEMISYAVAAHHGLFDCIDIEQKNVFLKRLNEIKDYDEACNYAKQSYLDKYELDQIFKKALEEFDDIWDKFKGLFTKVRTLLLAKGEKDAKVILFDFKFFLLACLQRLILSMLIDSDWEATSDFMDNVDTLSKHSEFKAKEIFAKAKDNFDVYMRRKQQAIVISKLTKKEKEILEARNSFQTECRNFAKHPAGIYCLPIPTGGGKTLSSLAYALEFCK